MAVEMLSRPQSAFTIIEVLFVSAVLTILSMVALRSMLEFNEQRKLRTAAVELSGFLTVARAAANAGNGPCTIQLATADGGTFSADSASEDSACPAGTIPPALHLGGLAGSKDLSAEVIRGSFPITFSRNGSVKQGATVLLSSQMVPTGGWCVDVQAPTAIVRLGWQPKDGNCNYTIEQ